jgi:hypothetical protein
MDARFQEDLEVRDMTRTSERVANGDWHDRNQNKFNSAAPAVGKIASLLRSVDFKKNAVSRAAMVATWTDKNRTAPTRLGVRLCSTQSQVAYSLLLTRENMAP